MNSAVGGLQCRAPVSPYTVLIVVILADCRIDLFENQLSLVQSNIIIKIMTVLLQGCYWSTYSDANGIMPITRGLRAVPARI